MCAWFSWDYNLKVLPWKSQAPGGRWVEMTLWINTLWSLSMRIERERWAFNNVHRTRGRRSEPLSLGRCLFHSGHADPRPVLPFLFSPQFDFWIRWDRSRFWRSIKDPSLLPEPSLFHYLLKPKAQGNVFLRSRTKKTKFLWDLARARVLYPVRSFLKQRLYSGFQVNKQYVKISK